MRASEVVAFWTAAGRRAWFAKDANFDESVREQLGSTHLRASRGQLFDWEREPEGALALVLLLDQAPRNIYRGSAHAFATDAAAREVAGRAIDRGADRLAPLALQLFFYLPFEHHENAASQACAVDLFTAYAERGGDEDYLRYARLHAEVIARFGRFPHRNAMLSRVSTPDEADFLKDGGFRG